MGKKQVSCHVETTLSVIGGRWKVLLTPGRPGGNPTAHLAGVSCPTATACTAVGAAGRTALAERWNGSAWTVQAIPIGAGTSSHLSAVSCTGPNACTAVGGRLAIAYS